jgi:light-regulated signal transduction histidine kinase (bacteriophytochrome)
MSDRAVPPPTYLDALGRRLDLDTCAQEPIHIPGAVQPFGVLLVLNEDDLVIRQASRNVETYLGRAAEQVIGRPIAEFLAPGEARLLSRQLLVDAGTSGLPLSLRFTATQRAADATVHRQAGQVLVELEPESAEANEAFYRDVRQAIARLQDVGSAEAVQRTAAQEIRRLTGFERVMVYRFDQHWNGEVVAESLSGGIDSFLGLHFPASDIPAQARELYRRNRLRLIPDATYTPVPLVPVLMPGSGAPLDMSACAVRSVSPIHLEYLRNMGVVASMSVSLLKEGNLWGLVACHHREPLLVPASSRAACEIIGQVASMRITALENEAAQAYRDAIRRIQTGLLRNVREREGVVQGLVSSHPQVAALIESVGGVVAYDGGFHRLGDVPDEAQTGRLVDWVLAEMGDRDVFVTDSLSSRFPEAKAYQGTVSGVLAIRLSREKGSVIMWFRPEVTQTVTWGGDPNKPMQPDSSGVRLSPRLSFAAWKETVTGRSRPWHPFEVEAADEFRGLLVDLVASLTERRALVQLRELERLKAGFLSSISHELRTPLHFITSFASVLEDEIDGPLNPAQHARLGKIQLGADQLLGLIDNLLDYTRMEAGEFKIQKQPTPFAEVLDDAIANLSALAGERGLSLTADLGPDVGAVVEADPSRITQVLYNLMANALKFTPPGGTVTVRGRVDGRMLRVEVVDTGPGLREEDKGRVFVKFFQTRESETGTGGQTKGSGLGLAIAKALVEAHGGTIGVESTYGHGSVFWFTLPLAQE